MNITQHDIFKATAAHQNCGQFLYYLNFAQSTATELKKQLNIDAEQDLAEYFKIPKPVEIEDGFEISIPSQNSLLKYYEQLEISEKAYFDHLGVLRLPGSTHHFTHRISPLRSTKTLKEIESYPFPRPINADISLMAEQVKTSHDTGKHTSCFVGQIYEWSWQIRGYEEFLMDMATNRDICCFVLDKLMHNCLEKQKAAAQAGVDMITSGDDVANQITLMFSIEQWRELIKPRWAKVFEAARAIKPDIQIFYHSDGNIQDIIPELIEIGVTILNPIQPECMDVEKLQKNFGDKLVFDGTIGTQTTMPFGKAEDVKNTIKARKRAFSSTGALIIAPTHVVEPEVPLDNILAFLEQVQL